MDYNDKPQSSDEIQRGQTMTTPEQVEEARKLFPKKECSKCGNELQTVRRYPLICGMCQDSRVSKYATQIDSFFGQSRIEDQNVLNGNNGRH